MARDIDFGFIPGLQHCGRAAVLVGGRTSVRDGVRHEDGAAVPDRLRAGVPDHDAAGQFTDGATVDVGSYNCYPMLSFLYLGLTIAISSTRLQQLHIQAPRNLS